MRLVFAVITTTAITLATVLQAFAYQSCRICPETGRRECGPKACEPAGDDCVGPFCGDGTIFNVVEQNKYLILMEGKLTPIEIDQLPGLIAEQTPDDPIQPVIILPKTLASPNAREQTMRRVEAFNAATENARRELLESGIDIDGWAYRDFIATYQEAVDGVYEDQR